MRRRTELTLGVEVYEVKLGDEFLMSSLFTEEEVALAALGLAGLDAVPLDVVVGGLGSGYTTRAVLNHPDVRSVLVVEALEEVIDWHRRGLVPLGVELLSDPRVELVQGDFFALAESPGIDSRAPGRRFHAILVDIDHSPRHVLRPSHAALYGPDGLAPSRDPPASGRRVCAVVQRSAGRDVPRFGSRDVRNVRSPRRALPQSAAEPGCGEHVYVARNRD